LIEKIIITSLIVMAIWATMWEDAIFDFVRTWGDKHLSEKPRKPIYDCPVCMTPWYGSLFYIVAYNGGLKEWLIVVIAAMGLNAVLIKLFNE
jgi:hypothetical protein